MGWSQPGPFPFPSPPARVRVFLTSVCPRRLFPFPVPVSPMCVPCVVCCLSRQVWGVTLEHCPRHQQDTQVILALRHLYRTVLHVNVVPHSQQASTAGQADHAGAVV